MVFVGRMTFFLFQIADPRIVIKWQDNTSYMNYWRQEAYEKHQYLSTSGLIYG